MSEIDERYPCTIEAGGEEIALTLMAQTDESAIAAFADSLPENDLLFLTRDIREPKVRAAWLTQVEQGEILSIAAKLGDEVVGTTAVVTDKLSFSAHVGELRVLVGPKAREIGLGRKLIQEAFLIGMNQGLDKLTVRMTIDQDAAIKVFEELGFKQEALFRDQVKDQAGKKHDLIILSHDVDGFFSQIEAYGLDHVGVE